MLPDGTLYGIGEFFHVVSSAGTSQVAGGEFEDGCSRIAIAVDGMPKAGDGNAGIETCNEVFGQFW